MLKSANEADQAIWTPFRRILTVQMSRKKIRDRLFLPHLSLSFYLTHSLSLFQSLSHKYTNSNSFSLSPSLSFLPYSVHVLEKTKKGHTSNFCKKAESIGLANPGKGISCDHRPSNPIRPTDRCRFLKPFLQNRIIILPLLVQAFSKMILTLAYKIKSVTGRMWSPGG